MWTPSLCLDALPVHWTGSITIEEFCNVVRLEFDQSTAVYALDSIALAAISVVGSWHPTYTLPHDAS